MTAEQIAFREIVLSHAAGWFPKTFSRIAELVSEEWGTVLDRRMYRVLATLVREGEIEKTADGYRLPPAKRRAA